MKTFYRLSGIYTIVALVGGVFYREFTKFNSFTDTTTLGFIHTHAFMLGMFFFLFLLVLEKQYHLSQAKAYKRFLYTYNAGLIITILMLLWRGITQVQMVTLSTGLDASISGIAGIGHILLGVGILFFFQMLKEMAIDKS